MTKMSRVSEPVGGPTQTVDPARLEAALLKVALLVAEDAAFTPIFERLEAELTAIRDADARLSQAQQRARTLLAQNAIPLTSSARCARDAPLP